MNNYSFTKETLRNEPSKHLEREMETIFKDKKPDNIAFHDRAMLERNFDKQTVTEISNKIKKHKKKVSFDSKINYKKTGNITGQNLEIDISEKGMPLRNGIYLNKKLDNTHDTNRLLGFDVYDDEGSVGSIECCNDEDDNLCFINENERENDKQNVKFMNGFNGNNNDDDNINDRMRGVLNSVNNSVNNINTHKTNNIFVFEIFDIMQNAIRNSFLISPYCIFINIIGLNIINDSICNYLKCEQKTIQSELETYQNIKNMGVIQNLIYTNQEKVNINPNIISLNKISDASINQVNAWINLATQGMINNIVSPGLLKNVTMLGMNIIHFHPKLKYIFNKKETQLMPFNQTRNVPMMTTYCPSVLYFEDKHNQAVELFTHSSYRVGIIVGRKMIPVIDNFYFNTIQKNIRKINIDRVCIPKFKIENKFKLQSVLKQTGLNINSLYNLNDIVQNISFVLSEGTDEITNSKTVEKIDFIANKPFVYYLLDDSKTVFLNGVFM